jgi:hypothetical protein
MELSSDNASCFNITSGAALFWISDDVVWSIRPPVNIMSFLSAVVHPHVWAGDPTLRLLCLNRENRIRKRRHHHRAVRKVGTFETCPVERLR